MIFPLFSKKLFSDRLFNIFFFVSLFLNILLWALVLYKVRPQEDPLFLHYNIYFGIDLIGSWKQLYYIPVSGTIIFFLNNIVAIFTSEKERIIKDLLGAVNIIAQLALIAAGVLIILLNF